MPNGTLYGDHLIDAFAVAIYAAVHHQQVEEAERELRSRPEAWSKYRNAAHGAIRAARANLGALEEGET